VVVLAAASFVLFGNLEPNFSDEGHLWYGAQRVLAGDIPIVDFRSYDPGRYYWAALWMLPTGDGLYSLRLANTLAMALALLLFAALARRVTKNRWLIMAGLFFASLWMVPLYKIYEHLISLLLVLSYARLVERPARSTFFFVGLCTSFAAIFGKNLGVYGLTSILIVVAVLAASDRLALDRMLKKRHLAPWLSGLVCGASPLLLLAL